MGSQLSWWRRNEAYGFEKKMFWKQGSVNIENLLSLSTCRYSVLRKNSTASSGSLHLVKKLLKNIYPDGVKQTVFKKNEIGNRDLYMFLAIFSIYALSRFWRPKQDRFFHWIVCTQEETVCWKLDEKRLVSKTVKAWLWNPTSAKMTFVWSIFGTPGSWGNRKQSWFSVNSSHR